MFGPVGGSAAFDKTFLILEALGIVLWIGLLFAGRRLPDWCPWAMGLLAVFLIVVLPVYWYVAYPVQHGIEGAGRILFLVPLVGLNLILAAISIFRVVRA